MITVVRSDEVPATVDLATGVFSAIYGDEGDSKFDAAHYASVWSDMIAKDKALICKRESEGVLREALGVMLFDDPATGEPSACVNFWYVADKARALEGGILFKWLQDTLCERGVRRLHLSCALGPRFHTMQSVLGSFGFDPVDVTFVKRL